MRYITAINSITVPIAAIEMPIDWADVRRVAGREAEVGLFVCGTAVGAKVCDRDGVIVGDKPISVVAVEVRLDVCKVCWGFVVCWGLLLVEWADLDDVCTEVDDVAGNVSVPNVGSTA